MIGTPFENHSPAMHTREGDPVNTTNFEESASRPIRLPLPIPTGGLILKP